MPDLTVEQVDRLMLVLDKLDAVLVHYDTTRKPRTRTKIVYRDPPDTKAVDLSELADSISRRLTLLEAEARAQGGPSLDVERLARALWNCHHPFDNGMDEARKVAAVIAAEYARLAPADPVDRDE